MSATLLWGLVLLSVVLFLVGDGILVWRKQRSMSRAFIGAYVRRPFILALSCLLVGYLLGHLTWPLEDCMVQIIREELGDGKGK